MQDVVRYNVIPLRPWLFLTVSRDCHKWALEHLHKVIISGSKKSYVRYWGVIKVLHRAGRGHLISEFTANNYDRSALGKWLKQLMRIRAFRMTARIEDILPYYRYINHLDPLTKAVFIEYITDYTIFNKSVVKIYELLPADEIRSNAYIQNVAFDIFNDGDFFTTLSDVRCDQNVTDMVRFAITHFPDYAREYARECIDGWPNAGRMLIRIVIDFGTEILDLATRQQLTRKYRSYRRDRIGREFSDRLDNY
ncbi:hypothetical protein F-M6_0011 [Faustovirus]|nr:hypothetical protein F-M6_0011 [Faustovirus]